MTEAATFWQGIARLPEPAQQSFWDAGVSLSRHIGEPPTPRRITLTYDTSRPPANAAWWERMLFYIGQGQYNQSVANVQAAQATADAVADGAQWLWGALQGDFNKNPTTGQIIVGGLISMIPLVDQACDVRDVIANCIVLSDAQARQDNENWIALALTCLGFVPEFGSAIKTVGKVAIRRGTRLIELLKRMEWFEHAYKQVRVGCPWTRGPLDWLHKFDWKAAAQQAATHAKQAFEAAQVKAQAAARYAVGAIKTKLQELAELFKQIAARIVQALSDVCARIKARIDELLKAEKKQAGNYGATPGQKPTPHVQGEVEPPKKPPPNTPASPHKVPCFHPYDKKKFQRMSPDEQKAYLKEMSKQLERQQQQINGMSAVQYKAARDAFDKNGRNPLAEGAQSAYREKFEGDLQGSIYESLERSNPQMSPVDLDAAARRQSAEIMKKLAALHEPDMVAGGWLQPDPKGMGRADVNSSIGGSWNQGGRVATMDTAAEEAINHGRGHQPMNVKLEVCRGNGLR